MEFDKSQLMRGTIEGCILQLISGEPTYGYDIVTRLQEYGFCELGEGTIYPLLLRLEKKGIVAAQFRPSPRGPSRKYYSLTKAGEQLLRDFVAVWEEVSRSVSRVLNEGGENDE